MKNKLAPMFRLALTVLALVILGGSSLAASGTAWAVGEAAVAASSAWGSVGEAGWGVKGTSTCSIPAKGPCGACSVSCDSPERAYCRDGSPSRDDPNKCAIQPTCKCQLQ